MHDSVINLDVLGMSRPNDDYIKDAKALAEELFNETKQMLNKNREKLDLIAETLLEVSIIDGEHFIKIMHEDKTTEA